MKRKFFLLGVGDPEMRMIEKIISEAGLPFAYATARGKPCHPGNAYEADPVVIPPEHCLVTIECEPVNIKEFAGVYFIDHHGIRDLGFYLGPNRFWEAASIGQLCRLIGIEPTQEVKVMAAFDHCFAAAIEGRCPGVSSDEVLNLKIEEIAKSTRTSEETVREKIFLYRLNLAAAREEKIGSQVVKDLRVDYLGEGYSVDLLAAQVAVTTKGQAALLRSRDNVGEPEKITLSGNIKPETVEAFLKEWAPMHGLVHTYGVPSRGYAGGYIV